MKLTYFQLEAHLAHQLAPFYILSGDEWMLKEEARGWIRKAGKHNGFSERIRLTGDASFDWEHFYTLLYSQSLLAEKRLIELNLHETNLPKLAIATLENYAKKPLHENVLLLEMGRLDAKISKSAWFQELEKTAVSIAIWPIPIERLPQWIINRAKKYKLSITREAATLISNYVEGNLAAAAQAIEKIYLLNPTCIDRDVIQNVLIDESRFTIFDFLENLITGNHSKTLHILEKLKTAGVEPIIILWGINKELRLLAELSQAVASGEKLENLLQKHRIFSQRRLAFQQFLRRHSTRECWNYLMHAAHIDLIIKGAERNNVWHTLQLFCLRLV